MLHLSALLVKFIVIDLCLDATPGTSSKKIPARFTKILIPDLGCKLYMLIHCSHFHVSYVVSLPSLDGSLYILNV